MPSLLSTELVRVWDPRRWGEVTVLVAVSGGPDSVALLRSIAEVAGSDSRSLCVAHFNHRWRGPDSDADESFVAALCEQLGIACHLGRATLAATGAEQAEEAARRQRYEFLQQTAQQIGARYVATGHTSDDQVETILHRILRGTGIEGLRGIQMFRCLAPDLTLVRPLLGVSRHQVLDYLRAINQSYQLDQSNQDLSLTRNRMRHELLPQLAEQFNPRVREAILRLGQVANEWGDGMDQLAEELLEASCQSFSEASGVELDRRVLHGRPVMLVREMLTRMWLRQAWPQQSMGFLQWTQLTQLLMSDQQVGSLNLPGSLVARVDGHLATIRKLG